MKKYSYIFIISIICLTVFSSPIYAQVAGENQLKRAQIYIENNDFDMAVKILEGMAKSNPNIDVYYLLGLSYRGQGNFEKAIDAFKNVLNRDNRCEPGFIQLANVYLEMKNTKEAEKTIAQLLRLNPKSAQAHYAAGVIFYAQKDILKAIREFKDATLNDTKYAPAYGNMGVAYYNKGQYKEALENFEKAANFDPLTPRYLFYAGWTSRMMGAKERSISYFRRSSNIKAPSVYSVTWKIIQAYDNNDYAKVNEHLKELEFIEKDFDKGLYFRGLMAINEKKYKEAEGFFQKMLDQDPLDKDALDQINKVKKLIEENPEPATDKTVETPGAPSPAASPTPSPENINPDKKIDENKNEVEKKEKEQGKTDYDVGIPIPKPDQEKEK